MSSAKWWPSCLGRNALMIHIGILLSGTGSLYLTPQWKWLRNKFLIKIMYSMWPSYAIWHHKTSLTLIQVMAWCQLLGADLLFELMPACRSDPRAWWRHQMETFSALLALCTGNSPVPGEFPSQRPVTRSFDVFFDLRLNKRLGKQSWGWWFETPSPSLWPHRNGTHFNKIPKQKYILKVLYKMSGSFKNLYLYFD